MGTLRTESSEVVNVVQWLNWADKDYVSARALLLADFLVQGAVLSNTAIEKYLKTICFMANIGFPKACHDGPRLSVILSSQNVILKLSQEYMQLLKKVYELRYPDNLNCGFNVSLSQAKLITELDSSVFTIRKGFDLKRASGKPAPTYFDHLLESQDNTLLAFNSSFGGVKRSDIFREKNGCYELRVLDNRAIVEASYRTNDVQDDGVFDVVGLRPGR